MVTLPATISALTVVAGNNSDVELITEQGDFTEVIKNAEGIMAAENSAPSYDYRILMEEQGKKVQIASYFSSALPPAVGTVLDIRQFKEASGFPDKVKVSGVEEPPRYMAVIVPHSTIMFVKVEPV